MWFCECEMYRVPVKHDLGTAILLFYPEIWWSPVESPHKGPVIQSLDAFFVLGQNKLIKKQSSCQWFQMPWRVCHVSDPLIMFWLWSKYLSRSYLVNKLKHSNFGTPFVYCVPSRLCLQGTYNHSSINEHSRYGLIGTIVHRNQCGLLTQHGDLNLGQHWLR